MGRLVGAGSLPDANYFLYTLSADLPFLNQAWLGQWLMWVAYDHFGHAGTIILRNLLLASAFAVVIVTALRRSNDARAVGSLGLVAAMLAYPVLSVRTRMFAFLPFAIVLWVVFGVADGRLRRRWLALVPVVTVFWANTHGSFVLSTAVVFAVGFGAVLQQTIEQRTVEVAAVRDWGLALCATALAGAASPLGLGVYGYVMTLTVDSSVTSTVTEWLPPNVAQLDGQIVLGAVVLSGLLLAVRRRSVTIGEALLYAGTLVLAVGAIRSLFWWAAVLPVVLAPHLAACLPKSDDDVPSRAEAIGLRLAVAAICLAVLAVQPGVAHNAISELGQSGHARRDGPGAWVLNHQNAETSIARIRADERLRVFHDQAIGGLLEFMLTDETPAQVAFVDQRMEFVPDEVWTRYFALSRASTGWGRELSRLGVDTLLLSPDDQWPLVQAALLGDEWKLVELDQSHVLLYRTGSFDRAQDPAEQRETQHEERRVHDDDDP